MTAFLKALWEHLTFKNGGKSKTALWLSIYLFIGLSLWFFLSLFAGNTLFGWWTVPDFDAMAFASIGSIVGGLYFANHNLTKWKVTDLPGKSSSSETITTTVSTKNENELVKEEDEEV